MCRISVRRLLLPALLTSALPSLGFAQNEALPAYLQDRGTGMRTSMFGTYIHEGELLVYPFFEYYRDKNMEYKPAEMGFGLDRDFRGKYLASEGILFGAYGLTDWLAVEFEAAVISASLEKAGDDPSSMPAKIKESGTGDVEGQIHLRWLRETANRPELFSYFEAVSPQQRDKVLIGTPDWEFALGSGLTRGFAWGTMTVRAAGEYTLESSRLEFGEFAVEYLKRLSPAWSAYLGVEGAQDEVELITEAQWRPSAWITVKLNNAFGASSKATDWAPEVGVIFSFPAYR